MAIENTNILNAPANEDLLKNRLISDEQKIVDQQPKEVVTDEKTITPEVVTSGSTTTQPTFSKNERLGLTLLPLASALLQGKRSGSGSLLGDTLASLGTGLANTTDVALKIKQLEAADRTKTATSRKSYRIQPNFKGKVQIGGKEYTAGDNFKFNFTADEVNAYPQGIFEESTKSDTADKTVKINISEEFDLGDGRKLQVGEQTVPMSIYNKIVASKPSILATTKDDADSTADVFTTRDATIGGVFFEAGVNRMTNEQIIEAQKIPGLFGKAKKEFAPSGFDKQKKRVTDILDKVEVYAKDNNIDIRNDIDQNIFDQLSDKDIFDLQLYIADLARPTIEKYVDERGNTITRERKRADVLSAYKNAFGDARYKQLINRIILGKEGDDSFEANLTKLEDGSEVDYDKIASGLVSKTDEIARQAKPLAKGEAESIAKSRSALTALTSASEVLFDANGEIRRDMLITPAQFLTQKGREKQKYVRAIEQAVEVLIRVRSGAAVPEQEFQRYKKMYTPNVFDSSEVARLKMNAIVNEFGTMIALLQDGRGQDLLKGFEQDKDGNITQFKFLNPDYKDVEFDDNEYFKNQASKQKNEKFVR